VLLRSITKHVKEQNWFAVGIDFLIVVVGIFVGLQVSAWNDLRGERQAEVTALVALHADIVSTASELQSTIDLTAASNTSLRVLAEYADGQHDDLSVAEIDRHILFGVFRIPGFSPNMVTYDELTNTGRLDLIRNTELRKRLQHLAAEIAELRITGGGIEKMAYETTDVFLLKNYDWRGFVMLNTNNGAAVVDWVEPMKDRRDVSSALRRPEFLNIILYRARLNMVYLLNANTLSKSLEDIKMLIEDRLEEAGHKP
jgi:hypothetical protein